MILKRNICHTPYQSDCYSYGDVTKAGRIPNLNKFILNKNRNVIIRIIL